jgi:hypothetical protein
LTQHPLKFYRWLPPLSFLAIMTTPFWPNGLMSLRELDVMGLIFLYSSGYLLVVMRKRKKSFHTKLMWPTGLAFLASLVLAAGEWFRSTSWAYGEWARRQLDSEIFPAFFRPSQYPADALDMIEPLVNQFFAPGLFGWFAILMGIAFLMNGFMENLLRSFSANNLRGQSRVFDKFNRWRGSDWVLIPLVVGLALVTLQNSGSIDEKWLILGPVGLNLALLALFPLFVQGMAIVAFFLPRLSFMSVLLVVVGLFLFPIPILVLAGLCDLWFDLRSRFKNRKPPQDQEAEE